jgi:hypothetical protein
MKTFKQFLNDISMVEGLEPLKYPEMIRKIVKKRQEAQSHQKAATSYLKQAEGASDMPSKKKLKNWAQEKTSKADKLTSQVGNMKDVLLTHSPEKSKAKELQNRNK